MIGRIRLRLLHIKRPVQYTDGWTVLRSAGLIALIAVVITVTGSPVWSRRPQVLEAFAAALQNGDLPNALIGFQEAEAQGLWPPDRVPFGTLALWCERYNRLDCAAYFIAQNAARAGWSASLNDHAARIALKQRDLPRAAAYWEQVIALAATNNTANATFDANATGAVREAWRGLGAIAIARRDWTQVQRLTDSMIAAEPNSRQGNLWRGLLLLPDDPRAAADALTRTGNDALAVRLLSSMGELYRQADAPSVAFQAGLLLMEAEQYGFAEYAFKRAIAGGVGDPAAFAYLGIAQDRLGEDGSGMVARAVASAPQDMQIQLLHALHLRLNDDSAAALDVLNAIGSTQPRDPYVALELARTTRTLGLIGEAAGWYAQAVYLAPDERNFAEAYALFILENGYELPTRGLQDLTSLNTRFADSAIIWTALAWAQISAAQPNSALQSFEKARAFAPDDPRPLFYQGLWLEQQVRPQEALDAWQQAVNLARNDPDQYASVLELARRALSRVGNTGDDAALLNELLVDQAVDPAIDPPVSPSVDLSLDPGLDAATNPVDPVNTPPSP